MITLEKQDLQPRLPCPSCGGKEFTNGYLVAAGRFAPAASERDDAKARKCQSCGYLLKNWSA